MVSDTVQFTLDPRKLVNVSHAPQIQDFITIRTAVLHFRHMQEEMDTQQIQYSFRGGGGANTKGMYRAAMVYRKLEIVRDNPL